MMACALMMKVLIPGGFMPVFSAGSVTIQICAGTVPGTANATANATGTGTGTKGAMSQSAMAAMAASPMSMAMPNMAHSPDKPDHQARDMPCAFSGLSAPSLASVDAVLLAVAIAFAVRQALRVEATGSFGSPAYLRPFLRGPPPYPAVI